LKPKTFRTISLVRVCCVGDSDQFMRLLGRALLSVVVFGLAVLSANPAAAAGNEFFVYAGTYTGFKFIAHGDPVPGSHSEGIYVQQRANSPTRTSPPRSAILLFSPSAPTIAFFTPPAKIRFPSGRCAITSLTSRRTPSTTNPESCAF